MLEAAVKACCENVYNLHNHIYDTDTWISFSAFHGIGVVIRNNHVDYHNCLLSGDIDGFVHGR